MKDAENAESESDGEESSSSSSSSGSSESDIGFKNGKKKKTVQPKPKRAPKPKAAPSVSSAVPEQSEAAPSEAVSNESKMSVPALTEKAKTCLKSLEDMTPWVIWSGSIKAKDFDARVNKGLDFALKLEAKSVTDLATSLTQEVDRCNQQSSLLKSLSSLPSDSEQLLTDNACEIANITLTLASQDISSFLTDIGRKLCDQLIASDGQNQTFFKFIVINESEDQKTFGLSYVVQENKKLDEPSTELMPLLFQCQAGLFNYFLDRFRSMGPSTDLIIKAIPTSWFLPDICRPGPGCHNVLACALPHLPMVPRHSVKV